MIIYQSGGGGSLQWVGRLGLRQRQPSDLAEVRTPTDQVTEQIWTI